MSDIPGFSGTASDFLAVIEDLLTKPGRRITVTSQDVFDGINPALLDGLLKGAVGDSPSMMEFLKEYISTSERGGGHAAAGSGAILAIPKIGMAAGTLLALGALVGSHKIKQYKHAKKHRHIARASGDFTISRAALGMRDAERAALRGMATLWAHTRITWEEWQRFYCQLAWAGGKSEIIAPDAYAGSEHIDEARKFFFAVCSHVYPGDHDHFIQLSGATLGKVAEENTDLGRMIASLINDGAHWMRPEDVPSSKVFKTVRTRASLQIGGLRPGDVPLYFDGNESLATIAGPGTGKTASQVIPNLLTYPGSCFVLDVKGELWEATAGHRAKAFGKVYRFAPTDSSGQSHCYNPFDVVPATVADAERECQIMASMIIPEQAGNRDPFWDNKAREYLWAFAMVVAYSSNPGWRHLGSVSRMFSLRTNFPDPNDYLGSDSHQIITKLEELAKTLNMPSLAQSARSLYGSFKAQKLLVSVLDSARSHLNPLTRSPTALAAMKTSDWHPLDLRRKPGTTVYFCLKPDEMSAYAPLVRLVFQQHVSQLTRNFVRQPGVPPVTFFLDEMPQLGYMPNMTQLIDVGRGAGIRLWMFMQYTSQLRDVYQVKGEGLINACMVRSYMSPDPEAAKAIEPLLGETRNIFTGEKKPLATAHELAGRAFMDDIVVIARDEHPSRLARLVYFKDKKLEALTHTQAPAVPRVPQAARPQPQNIPPASHPQHLPATPQQPALPLAGSPHAASLPAPKPAGQVPQLQRNRDPVVRPRQS